MASIFKTNPWAAILFAAVLVTALAFVITTAFLGDPTASGDSGTDPASEQVMSDDE